MPDANLKSKVCIQCSITIFLLVLFILLNQTDSSAEMTAAGISGNLNRLAQKGVSPQTLWNYGFTVFNTNPPEKNLAFQLYQGYSNARGSNEEQNRAIREGASYWKRRYDYWGKNPPVTTYKYHRGYPYNIKTGEWESTLPLARPDGGGPVKRPGALE